MTFEEMENIKRAKEIIDAFLNTGFLEDDAVEALNVALDVLDKALLVCPENNDSAVKEFDVREDFCHAIYTATKKYKAMDALDCIHFITPDGARGYYREETASKHKLLYRGRNLVDAIMYMMEHVKDEEATK